MAGPTPQITLQINLLDYKGVQLGTATKPAYVRIALCNFGQFLPRVPTSGMMTRISTAPNDIPYIGAQISVALFGNDVILPSNTYYSISLLDDNKNVVQSGAYQFTGTATLDLSTLTPITITPGPPPIPSLYIVIPYSLTPVIDLSLGDFYAITLTGDATITAINPQRVGQRFTLLVFQDGTGAHVLTCGGLLRGAMPNGLVPNLCTAYEFRYNGTNCYILGVPVSDQ